MTLFGRHPYSFLFAGAGIVLLIIVITAKNQSTPATIRGPEAYVSSGSTLMNPGISAPGAYAQNNTPVSEPAMSGIAFSYTTPTPVSTPASFPTQQPLADTFPSVSVDNDGTNFTLSTSLSESDTVLKAVYSLIPSGVSMPAAPQPRSSDQQALYEYGNEAGLAVLTFGDDYSDMAEVLKDWLSDRTSASRRARVERLADGLTQAGISLEQLPDVPPAAAAANAGLATAYKNAGEKMHAVAAAGSVGDTALVEAMQTYNATVDSFTASYIALANIFSIYGVNFNEGDTGSAFQFSNNL